MTREARQAICLQGQFAAQTPKDDPGRPEAGADPKESLLISLLPEA
ncbi:hypothetical protein JCM14036_12500 [Desulfotomaculum defluvii]